MTLLVRSIMVLSLLFGLLFAVAMAVLAHFNLPWIWGVAFAAGVILLQYAFGPTIIQWIYKIRWAEMTDFSPEVREYLHSVCRASKIPVPRLGVIEDGNPNAFTFGHYPGDARLIVTRGILDLLDEDEQKAVIGHEVGHIVHWDFVVMTVAAMVPLLLYMLYRATVSGNRGSGSRRGNAAWVGLIAYVAYIISQYIVLLLSRVREYYADEFSGQSTRNPNALSRALVKIAYGLARAPQDKEKKDDLVTAQAGKAFGIFDHKVAGNLALAAAGMTSGTKISSDTIVNAMKWDLWNPWATWFEVHSTHPVPAKRIRALEQLSTRLGQAPVFNFPETQPESYWDEFAVDFLTNLLPIIGLILGAGLGGLLMSGHSPLIVAGTAVLGLGIGSLIKLVRSHPQGSFPARAVDSLVSEVKVSGVRSVPCTVEGKIIGRGVPGLYWSEDLVLQDDSGFIVLDYNQPIGFLNFLFGAFRAESLVGQQARAVGWFRRAPRPYVELLRVEFDNKPAQRCWTYTASLVMTALIILFGALIVASTYLMV